MPAQGLSARPIAVAEDPENNIFFVEDSGGLSGVLEIPASATTTITHRTPTLPRVDPMLPAVKGVITDAAGNLYISDSQTGVVEVPNPSGTPLTSSAILLSGVPAGGQVAIDAAHNVMYVPTSQTQPNGQADVAKVGFGYAEFGSSAVGTTAAGGSNVVFGFNGAVTPASFAIVEDGVHKSDFAITGGTCTTGVAYATGKSCLQNLSFTPNSVGNISAKLLMLDARTTFWRPWCCMALGWAQISRRCPGLQSAFGSGLLTPTQVTTDALGNVYVADPGQGKVLEYAPGSTSTSTAVSIGTGLTTPTGVAVDGAGDVFIADSSTGSVYEVPFGTTGLNAAGQVTSGERPGHHRAATGRGWVGPFIYQRSEQWAGRQA